MRGEPHQGHADHAAQGRAAPLVFTIDARGNRPEERQGKIVEPGYGWLRIVAVPGADRRRHGRQAGRTGKQEPNLKGLVLDLRNDPGGLLQGAIGVAAAFLPKDAEIVSTNGQLPESKQRFYGRPEYYMLRADSDPLSSLPAAVSRACRWWCW
jgi:carboxyl-terminal processing protease